jgi:hypothetical protein
MESEYCVIRVRGTDAEEARHLIIEEMLAADEQCLLYDTFCSDLTISQTVASDDSFYKLRERELTEYKSHLEKALKMSDDDPFKGGASSECRPLS